MPKTNVTTAYRVWMHMRSRCLSPTNDAYADYGGRGITICERWSAFAHFLADMGEPAPGLTIDRLDNDGPYCKANCEWRTKKDQARNRRSNVPITFNGTTRILIEWAEFTGLPYATLRHRVKRGWTADRTLTQPLRVTK